jgi:hypothetical protein
MFPVFNLPSKNLGLSPLFHPFSCCPHHLFCPKGLKAEDEKGEKVVKRATFITFQGPPTKNGVGSVIKWRDLISTLKWDYGGGDNYFKNKQKIPWESAWKTDSNGIYLKGIPYSCKDPILSQRTSRTANAGLEERVENVNVNCPANQTFRQKCDAINYAKLSESRTS